MTTTLAGTTTLNVTLPVSNQRLADLLCSAVESGSHYWAMFDELERTDKLDYLSVRVHDMEEPSNPSRVVTLADMARGLTLCLQNDIYCNHACDFLRERGDAITADVILQFALFEDVIYG